MLDPLKARAKGILSPSMGKLAGNRRSHVPLSQNRLSLYLRDTPTPRLNLTKPYDFRYQKLTSELLKLESAGPLKN